MGQSQGESEHRSEPGTAGESVDGHRRERGDDDVLDLNETIGGDRAEDTPDRRCKQRLEHPRKERRLAADLEVALSDRPAEP